MKIKGFIFTLLLLSTALGVQGQSKGDRPWVSINLGNDQYSGDLDNEMLAFDVMHDLTVGAGLHYYLNEYINLNYALNFGILDEDYNSKRFSKSFLNNNATAHFKFANGKWLAEDAKVQPFIGAGLGLTAFFAGDEDIDNNVSFGIPMLLGADVPLTTKSKLEFKLTYNRTFNDQIDGAEFDDRNHDDFIIATVGYKYNLFGSKDSDGDGVPDNEDKCPDVAGLPQFGGCADTDGDRVPDPEDLCPDVPGLPEFNGCPDSDGDGIIDEEDQCPQIAGLAEFGGCPDTDGDGIKDSEDNCPEIAGLMSLNGCPDSDGDGVADEDDACPELAGPVNGCPDTDGDGVADKDDLCKDLAGSLENKGCPDTDGDGVIDINDKCPETAGLSSNNGCPEVEQELQKQIQEIFYQPLFPSGSTKVAKSSEKELDKLIKILNDNSSIIVTIEGHTDNTGNPDYNLKLSQLRAEAVKQYLLKGGISADRVEAIGYGITQPIASNDTAEGRRKNRRVELVVSYK